MNENDLKHLRKCEARRRLGKRKFVVAYGVCLWGIPVGLVTTLVDAERNGVNWAHIGIAAICWLIAGVFFGLWMWHSSEKGYERLIAGDRKEKNA